MKQPCFILSAALCLAAVFPSRSDPDRKILDARLPRLTRQSALEQRLDPSTELKLTLALPAPDPAGLDRYLHDLYTPSSPAFHHYLTPPQFARRFGPSEADYERVIGFARASGFAIAARHSNRMALEVSAAAADAEKALRVRFVTYPHPREKRRFFTAENNPSVPSSLPVMEIVGLDDFESPQPLGTVHRFLDNSTRPSAEDYYGSGPVGTYVPADLRGLYEMNSTLNGAGQIVGLLEFDTYYATDIRAFENEEGLPHVPIHTEASPGALTTPGRASAETALDIEMAAGMAPGLAGIIVYQGPQKGSYVAAFDSLLARIAEDDGAAQISSSWTSPSVRDPFQYQLYQQLAAQGQSFFQGAGDDGAYTNGVVQQADNPYITIVGGTTPGPYDTESVWHNGTSNLVTGGGISTNYLLPTYQAGLNLTAVGGSTNWRNSPDVAAVADGVYARINNGRRAIFEGTSISTPVWAGFAALINQQASSNGLPRVGFLNPSLYALGQSGNYNNCLRDITSGDNTTVASPNNFYAAPGYDLCTGWGSPAGQALIDALTINRAMLSISPTEGFAATAIFGDVLLTNETIFTLQNNGVRPVSWAITNLPDWLEASANSGRLKPNQSSQLQIAFSPAAANLDPGLYAADVVVANLTAGTEQTLSFSFQLFEDGSLRVFLSPPAAVVAGAAWRVDEGPWQTNGATVPGLLDNAHLVEFAPITNWDAPAAQMVNVPGGQSLDVGAVYTNQIASIQVGLHPMDAVMAGARWQLDGGAWQTNGTILATTAGDHTLSFASIAGWNSPADRTVSLPGRQTSIESGCYAEPYQFTTIVGPTGHGGKSPLASPNGLAVDSAGNLFVADTGNYVFREISPGDAGWTVSTIAGSLGVSGNSVGTNEDATFQKPYGVALDPSGGVVYFTDPPTGRYGEIVQAGRDWVTSLIGQSWMGHPTGLVCDQTNFFYVSELGDPGFAYESIHSLLETNSTWTVQNFYDFGGQVDFGDCFGVTVVPAVGPLVANSSQFQIQTIGTVSSWFGSSDDAVNVVGSGVSGSADGVDGTAQFSALKGLAADASGNVYVADTGNNTIRKLYPFGMNTNVPAQPNYAVTTIGGSVGIAGNTDGLGASALFNAPSSLTVDSNETIYISDTGNNTIRKGTPLLPRVCFLAEPAAPDGQTPQFQMDNGPWIAVGAILRLLPGQHTVSFSPAAGYQTPSNQVITISSNAPLLTVFGDYVPMGGSVSVVIAPSDAASAGAEWQLDGGPWQPNGAVLGNIPYGPHTLGFAGTGSWQAPADVQISVDSATNLYSFAFTPIQTPTITISSPLPGAVLTNLSIVVSGAASNNVAIATIWVDLTGPKGWSTGMMQADGTNSWEITIPDVPTGRITAQAFAMDASGNEGQSGAVTFNNAPTAAVTLSVAGQGSVSPAFSLAYFPVGHRLALSANPAAGWLFDSWQGDIFRRSASLSVSIESNTVLEAVFVPNPYPSLAGSYNGLFLPAGGDSDNDPVLAASGSFSANLSRQGAYTAALQLQGHKFALTGRFDSHGAASNYIARASNPISLQMSVDLSGSNGMTGQLDTPNWHSSLSAYRNVFSKTFPAPQAGRYTVHFLPPRQDAFFPSGDGFGAATVSASGIVQFTGTLGDTTVVSQSASLSANGHWPFYASLYGGGGEIIGWLAFTNQPDADLVGQWSWVKTSQISSSFYPAGFYFNGEAEGSAYRETSGSPLLNLTAASISFSNSSVIFTNLITYNPNNTISSAPSDHLSLAISAANGLFHGSISAAGSRAKLSLSGAILQKQNAGYGLFPAKPRTGRVILGPAP